MCFRLVLEVELGQTGLAEDLVGEGAGQGGDRLDEPDKEGGRCNISGAAKKSGKNLLTFLYFVELFGINCC